MRIEGFLAGVFLIIVLGFLCHQWIVRRKKRNYPKNVVMLHQFPRTPVAPNLSPFAIKLETYLRMAKIPYKNVYTYEFSPKHKTPWIVFNGEIFSDTHFIIQFLNRKFDIDLNQHLSQTEKAVARAMQKMTEENLFWSFIVSRWVYGSGDPSLRKITGLNRFLVWRVRKIVEPQAYSQGIGRHNHREVESIARDDLQALSDFMGEKKFLMGNEPCETDCTIFGMISLMWQMPVTSFCYKFIKENTFPNLTAYFYRMKKEFWPEWTDNTKIGEIYGEYNQYGHDQKESQNE